MSDLEHPLRDGLPVQAPSPDGLGHSAGIPDALRIVSQEECPMWGDFIIRLSDGRSCKFDRREMQQGSIEAWAAIIGVMPTTERVDVIQYGRKVGELPAFWTPMLAKSKSFLYDYRHGDLTLRDGKWYASKTLGGGDLDMLIGFVRKDAP